MIELNTQQRDAVDCLHDFVTGNKGNEAVLKGYAGTGKTTSITRFLQETDSETVLTAPTNKAVKVLRGMAAEAGNERVKCVTLHKLLGLKPKKQGEVLTFAPDGTPEISRYRVVVVDECSMVGSSLRAHLVMAAAAENVKIIYMGDPMQLPPVGEEMSETFMAPVQMELTQVVRHDNQILKLTMALRDSIKHGTQPAVIADNDENGGVFTGNWRAFNNAMSRGYSTESYKKQPDSYRTVAWRNATVKAHNEFIRSALYGREVPELFQVGERVVACGPITEMDDLRAGEFNPKLSTDEEATVRSVRIAPHPIHANLECQCVSMVSDFGVPVEGWVLMDVSRNAYQRMITEALEDAKARRRTWAQFWSLKESVHDIRPSHSITTHRSQGSTYETVFVDMGDIMVNRNKSEALRCLYVAASRASRIVVVKL